MGFSSSSVDQCGAAAILKSIIFWMLISAVGLAEASIHIYDRVPFREVGNAFLVSGGSEGIAGADSGSRSYIRFENVTFWRSKEDANRHPSLAYNGGLVQVIIFEASDRDNIGGSAYGGQRSICCTPDLAKLEGCKQGEVIRTPSASDKNWPVVINVYFRGNMLSTHMKKSKEVNIKRTGMYNLFFITCDPKLKDMRVTGKTMWKNPSGYLPGRMSPLMKFYVFMSISYAILCGVWVFQYVRYWDDVLLLQHCITSVIALGLLEMTFWYFDFAYFNSMGVRPIGITTWVVTIGSVRKTISRILILSVAMGYGVVRPTLGGLTVKVLLVGITYFLATEMLNIAENVGSINDIAGRARVFFVVPVAFLDAFLILWIFTSLSKTLEQLQAKRSSIKLDIYRKFSNALALTVVASVVWIGYELYFKATDPFNERWQNAWIITAFWDVLAFALLCVICYLWAPSQSSQRYAYMDNKGDETDDEETESLCRETSKGSISLVKQGQDDRNNGNTSDSEESEEGKRE
ncbi:lung seven transmembrane receptor family protein [Striga asiatica]|uniref:Lung seven transmembrane receptor family protein n=1 Tax=Striga asiatica TaxID=4170 RepID=A0A5A7PCL0_STRAF|nr:lung seven transmembrane receptor family protein [Striga asiatica]